MAKTERVPELREFIQENDQRLYDFCYYMLYGGFDVEDLVLDIFRTFGDRFRRARSQVTAWGPLELRLQLFALAWEFLREAMVHSHYSWPVGRDTRQLKGLDDDLLGGPPLKRKDPTQLGPQAVERLSRVDPDFRAPVVLHDILKFEDEEVVRILGIRWGVYRHRLHRGRLDFKEGLRGRSVSVETKGSLSV